ncbi:MAG: hypothetical protein RIT81_20795 [Deltaproteobacteria bacterium]
MTANGERATPDALLEAMASKLRAQGDTPQAIAAGVRVVVPYESELCPEWVVVSVEPCAHLVMLDDELTARPQDTKIRADGQEVVARIGPVIATPLANLHDAERIGTIDAEALSRVRVALEDDSAGRIPPRFDTRVDEEASKRWAQLDEEARRFARATGGAILGAQPSRDTARRDARPPHRARRWRRWAAALSVVGALFVLLWLRPQPPQRDRAGAYLLRSAAGEAGIELRIDGRVCLARGVLGTTSCKLPPGASVRMVYRRDTQMPQRFVRVTANGEPLATTEAALAPTTHPDGSERCEGGFCDVGVDLRVSAPTTLRVTLSAEAGGSTKGDPHAIDYTFALE